MKVEILGKGEPEYSVVYCIHGDEPSGKKAVEKLKNRDIEILKPLKLIFANEKAYQQGKRYVDKDLNRVFPGEQNADSHEEQLAYKIMQEINDTENLLLHSTQSQPTPFGIVGEKGRENELYQTTGTGWAVIDTNKSGTLENSSNSVLVEAGPQRTDKADKEAYKVLKNFLASQGIIKKEYFKPFSRETRLYRYKETVKHEGYKFTAKNFEKVEKGEVYAVKNGEELKADEEFYPFLMSTSGYDFLGFKAEKVD